MGHGKAFVDGEEVYVEVKEVSNDRIVFLRRFGRIELDALESAVALENKRDGHKPRELYTQFTHCCGLMKELEVQVVKLAGYGIKGLGKQGLLFGKLGQTIEQCKMMAVCAEETCGIELTGAAVQFLSIEDLMFFGVMIGRKTELERWRQGLRNMFPSAIQTINGLTCTQEKDPLTRACMVFATLLERTSRRQTTDEFGWRRDARLNNENIIKYEREVSELCEPIRMAVKKAVMTYDVHFVKVEDPVHCYHVLFPLVMKVNQGMPRFDQIVYCSKKNDAFRRFVNMITTNNETKGSADRCEFYTIVHPEFLDETEMNHLKALIKALMVPGCRKSFPRLLIISSMDFVNGSFDDRCTKISRTGVSGFRKMSWNFLLLLNGKLTVELVVSDMYGVGKTRYIMDTEAKRTETGRCKTQFIDSESCHVALSEGPVHLCFARDVFETGVDFWDEIWAYLFTGIVLRPGMDPLMKKNEVITLYLEEPEPDTIMSLNDLAIPLVNSNVTLIKSVGDEVASPRDFGEGQEQKDSAVKDPENVKIVLMECPMNESYARAVQNLFGIKNEKLTLRSVLESIYKPLFGKGKFPSNVSHRKLWYVNAYLIDMMNIFENKLKDIGSGGYTLATVEEKSNFRNREEFREKMYGITISLVLQSAMCLYQLLDPQTMGSWILVTDGIFSEGDRNVTFYAIESRLRFWLGQRPKGSHQLWDIYRKIECCHVVCLDTSEASRLEKNQLGMFRMIANLISPNTDFVRNVCDLKVLSLFSRNVSDWEMDMREMYRKSQHVDTPVVFLRDILFRHDSHKVELKQEKFRHLAELRLYAAYAKLDEGKWKAEVEGVEGVNIFAACRLYLKSLVNLTDNQKFIAGTSICWMGFVKLLSILTRIRLKQPTVMSGDTGCGKTSLFRVVSVLLSMSDPDGYDYVCDILNVHGDIGHAEIDAAWEACAAEHSHAIRILFCDEFNTTSVCPYIEYKLMNSGMRVIGAVNIRKKNDEISAVLSKVGMPQKLLTNPELTVLVNRPCKQEADDISEFKYFVHKLSSKTSDAIVDCNPSMTRVDENKFMTDEEKFNIESLIYSLLTNSDKISIGIGEAARVNYGHAIETLMIKKFTECVLESMTWIRTFMDERAVVSFRDVRSAAVCLLYFLNQLRSEDSNQTEQVITDAVLFSMVVTFGLRLPVCMKLPADRSRAVDQHLIGMKGRGDIEFNEEEGLVMVRDSYFKRLQSPDLVDRFDRFVYLSCWKDVIRKNDSWKFKSFIYHVFVIKLCVKLKITVFIIGLPGTSKSYALEHVRNGKCVNDSAMPKLAYCSVYMCSRGSSSEGLKSQYYDAAYVVMSKNGSVTLCTLEEMGLANSNPRRPFKYLHFTLDRGVEVAPGVYVRVSTAGVTNYVMDYANMNRGTVIFTDVPSRDELISVFASLSSDFSDLPDTEISRYYADDGIAAYCAFEKKRTENETSAVATFLKGLWGDTTPTNISLRSVYKLLSLYIDTKKNIPHEWVFNEMELRMLCQVSREIVASRRLLDVCIRDSKRFSDISKLYDQCTSIIKVLWPKCNVKEWEWIDNITLCIERLSGSGCRSKKSMCIITENYASVEFFEDLRWICSSLNGSGLNVGNLKSMACLDDKKFSDIFVDEAHNQKNGWFFAEDFKRSANDLYQLSIHRIVEFFKCPGIKIPAIVGSNRVLDSLLDVLNPYDESNEYQDVLVGIDGFSGTYRINTSFFLVLIVNTEELAGEDFPIPLLDRLENVFLSGADMRRVALMRRLFEIDQSKRLSSIPVVDALVEKFLTKYAAGNRGVRERFEKDESRLHCFDDLLAFREDDYAAMREDKDVRLLIKNEWKRGMRCVIATRCNINDDIETKRFADKTSGGEHKELIIFEDDIANEKDFGDRIVRENYNVIFVKCGAYSKARDQQIKKLLEEKLTDNRAKRVVDVFIIYHQCWSDDMTPTIKWPIFWIDDISIYPPASIRKPPEIKAVFESLRDGTDNSPEKHKFMISIIENMIKRMDFGDNERETLTEVFLNWTTGNSRMLDVMRKCYDGSSFGCNDSVDESDYSYLLNRTRRAISEKAVPFLMIFAQYAISLPKRTDLRQAEALGIGGDSLLILFEKPELMEECCNTDLLNEKTLPLAPVFMKYALSLSENYPFLRWSTEMGQVWMLRQMQEKYAKRLISAYARHWPDRTDVDANTKSFEECFDRVTRFPGVSQFKCDDVWGNYMYAIYSRMRSAKELKLCVIPANSDTFSGPANAIENAAWGLLVDEEEEMTDDNVYVHPQEDLTQESDVVVKEFMRRYFMSMAHTDMLSDDEDGLFSYMMRFFGCENIIDLDIDVMQPVNMIIKSVLLMTTEISEETGDDDILTHVNKCVQRKINSLRSQCQDERVWEKFVESAMQHTFEVQNDIDFPVLVEEYAADSNLLAVATGAGSVEAPDLGGRSILWWLHHTLGDVAVQSENGSHFLSWFLQSAKLDDVSLIGAQLFNVVLQSGEPGHERQLIALSALLEPWKVATESSALAVALVATVVNDFRGNVHELDSVIDETLVSFGLDKQNRFAFRIVGNQVIYGSNVTPTFAQAIWFLVCFDGRMKDRANTKRILSLAMEAGRMRKYVSLMEFFRNMSMAFARKLPSLFVLLHCTSIAASSSKYPLLQSTLAGCKPFKDIFGDVQFTSDELGGKETAYDQLNHVKDEIIRFQNDTIVMLNELNPALVTTGIPFNCFMPQMALTRFSLANVLCPILLRDENCVYDFDLVDVSVRDSLISSQNIVSFTEDRFDYASCAKTSGAPTEPNGKTDIFGLTEEDWTFGMNEVSEHVKDGTIKTYKNRHLDNTEVSQRYVFCLSLLKIVDGDFNNVAGGLYRLESSGSCTINIDPVALANRLPDKGVKPPGCELTAVWRVLPRCVHECFE